MSKCFSISSVFPLSKNLSQHDQMVNTSFFQAWHVTRRYAAAPEPKEISGGGWAFAQFFQF